MSGKQATFDGDSLLWMTEYSDARFFDFRTNSQVIVPSAIYRGINPYKILADKKSNKWVLSSDFTKFYRIDKNRVFTILDFSFPSRNLIRDFAIDSSGNVFVASDSGLLKRDVRTENWAFVPLKDSVRKNLTRITIDEGNNIWFDVNSTCYQFSEINGLKLLDGQNVSLPIYDNFFPTGNFVTYRNNKWWFAARNGLVSFDGQNYKTYNAVNSPMPTNYITSLFTDKLGNLWMNHKYGLTVFNENSLVDLRTFVKEISQKYGIKSQVSPNPLSKNGILSFENPERKLFELTIFDANGKTVIYQTATENRFIIQNQDLMNGIYFYNLKNNAETGFGKFVVQH